MDTDDTRRTKDDGPGQGYGISSPQVSSGFIQVLQDKIQGLFQDYYKAMVFLLFVLRIRRPSILGFWKKNKIAFTYFFYSRRLP